MISVVCFLYCHNNICRCAAISTLLSLYACYELSGEYLPCFECSEDMYSLTLHPQLRECIKKLPRAKSKVLLTLLDVSLDTEQTYTVWHFMDTVVSSANLPFNLAAAVSGKNSSLWIIDRKKEKTILTALKLVSSYSKY